MQDDILLATFTPTGKLNFLQLLKSLILTKFTLLLSVK